MENSLDPEALSAKIGDHDLDAALLDRAQAARRDSQRHETLLALQPEPVGVQIRQKAAPLAIVRVGDRVARFGPLAGDLADSRHDLDLRLNARGEPRFISE